MRPPYSKCTCTMMCTAWVSHRNAFNVIIIIVVFTMRTLKVYCYVQRDTGTRHRPYILRVRYIYKHNINPLKRWLCTLLRRDEALFVVIYKTRICFCRLFLRVRTRNDVRLWNLFTTSYIIILCCYRWWWWWCCCVAFETICFFGVYNTRIMYCYESYDV